MTRSFTSTLVAAAVAFVAVEACAVRHVGFETDAFNRVYPASYKNTFVFSPASFELDCVLIAEALDTIPKANVASMMGVVIDFQGAYCPILDALEMGTNGLSYVCARGFCVPDIRAADANFRTRIQREYRTEVLRLVPKLGAEAWFRATMDGEMEDFEISDAAANSGQYMLYDLVSVTAEWADPFPLANTRMRPFRINDSTNTVDVAVMSDVRIADTLETKEFTLLVLPLKGDAEFFALLPKAGYTLSDTRVFMTSMEIDGILSFRDPGSSQPALRCPCAIEIPRIEISSRTSFAGALRYFRIPMEGLRSAAGDFPGGDFVQFTKFSIAECGRGKKPPKAKNPEDAVPVAAEVKKVAFDRPFLFFVYHPGTATIPVAGQFMGVEAKTGS